MFVMDAACPIELLDYGTNVDFVTTRAQSWQSSIVYKFPINPSIFHVKINWLSSLFQYEQILAYFLHSGRTLTNKNFYLSTAIVNGRNNPFSVSLTGPLINSIFQGLMGHITVFS